LKKTKFFLYGKRRKIKSFVAGYREEGLSLGGGREKVELRRPGRKMCRRPSKVS